MLRTQLAFVVVGKRAHEQHAAQSAELQAQLTTAREALNQKERELFAAKTELANRSDCRVFGVCAVVVV